MLTPYGYVPSKIIRRIFQDHWEDFLRQHKEKLPEDMLRSVVKAVNKMLVCGTKEMGFTRYI
jgi:hypothetical protein